MSSEDKINERRKKKYINKDYMVLILVPFKGVLVYTSMFNINAHKYVKFKLCSLSLAEVEALQGR